MGVSGLETAAPAGLRSCFSFHLVPSKHLQSEKKGLAGGVLCLQLIITTLIGKTCTRGPYSFPQIALDKSATSTLNIQSVRLSGTIIHERFRGVGRYRAGCSVDIFTGSETADEAKPWREGPEEGEHPRGRPPNLVLSLASCLLQRQLDFIVFSEGTSSCTQLPSIE